MELTEALPERLLAWYDEVKDRRHLPWRGTKEPYRVWVSEIMLQQTRAEAVKPYYLRFLRELPDIPALAECDDERLRKLWEGLGYYSRVRNLKKAAQILCREYGGSFPREPEAVLALPGIGEYTAGAILSICFDRKIPAVDGNVLRVLARLRGDDTPIDTPAAKKAAANALTAVYPDRAGDFTQALMELGATVCGPDRAPDCGQCPCQALCSASRDGTQSILPVRLPKRSRRQEDLTVFILRCGDRLALRKRPENGLLAGLWEFPHTEGLLDTEQALARLQDAGIAVSDICRIAEKRHDFTHIRWNMRGYYLEASRETGDYIWLTDREIAADAALPTAFRQFLDVPPASADCGQMQA